MVTRVLSVCFALGLAGLPSIAQQPKLVDFQQHIQPIFENRCLKCHGSKEAKNDFRVDQREGLLAYIQPGDVEASSLWTDYLRAQDPEMLMPPATETEPGGLPVAELLLVKTWIAEGAEGGWSSDAAQSQEQQLPGASSSQAVKVWSFQGLFHPAVVHFPVALLSVSTLFVLFSFFNRPSCEPVAFHCLWLGGLGAIAACLTGWSYAVYEGYGTAVGFDLANSSLDRHRWAGVFVAVFAMLTIPLAARVRRDGGAGKRFIWLLASTVLAGAVSIAGYQGGELTYGEDHYLQYFKRLFPHAATEATPPVEPNSAQPADTDPVQPDAAQTTSPEASDKPSQPGSSNNQPPVSSEPNKTAEPSSTGEPTDPSEPTAPDESSKPSEPSNTEPVSTEPIQLDQSQTATANTEETPKEQSSNSP